ncbi:MAG: single-stranded DNA-binding protein [Ruminococcaceae bacterium]|nr:single-stranded DNA-binding protein [Oscillospiraceae bacterium]
MLNMVAIMGRLTTDPELRHTTNSIPVTTFTLAVNRSYVKQGGERQTDFIDVVAWRNTAEFICRYFKKGQMMAVEGSIQTRTYTDKEGRYRKVFEILANNVYFTESRSSSASATYETKSDDYSDQEDNFNLSFSSGDADDFTVIDDDEDLPF